MEDRDRDVLKENRMYLSRNIGKTQIVNVVNELYSRDVFTYDDMESILNEPRTSSKVFELLDRLVCCGPKAFDAFLQVLQCCGCQFVAATIQQQLTGTPIQEQLTGNFSTEAYEKPGTFCIGLPTLTSKFTGRNEDCEEITTKLTFNDDDNRICLVVAPPGFGKTETATAVGYMMKDQGNNILYFSLRNVKLMTTAAKNMLETIGIPVGGHPIWQITQHLQSLLKQTVLILDNAEDLQNGDGSLFSQFLEAICKNARNLVTLITSRICLSKRGAHFDILVVPLKPLTDEQSLVFLKIYNVEDLWAKRFSQFNVCGGVPLLLKITASFLTQSGTIDPVELHRNLQKCKDKFLMSMHPDIQDLQCHLGVFYNYLPPYIKKALSCLAAFPTVFTKREAKIVLFEDEDELNFQFMLDTIEKHSLVHGDDVEGCQQYSLHPLVQAFCVTSSENQSTEGYTSAIRLFSQHYLTLLHQANEDFISTTCKDAIKQYQLNKINICHALMAAANDKCLNYYGLRIATETVNFLAKCMNMSEFLSVYEKFLKVAKDRGEQGLYSECLAAIGFKQVCFHGYKDAHDTVAMANLEEAHNLLKSLDIKNECRGYCACKLGLCTLAAAEKEKGISQLAKGKKEKGISLLAQGIALRKSLARAENAGKTEEMLVGGGFSDLAMAMFASGKYLAAINIWKNICLVKYRRILGTHPFTASVLDYLGSAYQKYDCPQEAVKCKRESLEMRRLLLGEEHLDTARAYYGLGCSLGILGSITEAIENLEKAKKIQVHSHASQQHRESTQSELQYWRRMQPDKCESVTMVKEL
ncbi:uncharacterized protein LOC114973110 [Acropora millepora]|uniref:uncharacterized protein LOC114973110 n=1 Tax=Acropora millepora TaxID=45264 RepID=UPI001CF249F8|nr:uncharacterized protein LOC114973110 [Acropora millepora]